MSKPLAILNLGMVSSLSNTAEGNAALMRIGYSNALPSQFYPSGSDQAWLGAIAHFSDIISGKLMGIARWVELLRIACSEALSNKVSLLPSIPLIACFPEPGHNTASLSGAIRGGFLPRLTTALQAPSIGQGSSFSMNSRVSFLNSVQQAREQIYQHGAKQVLLVAVDSLLNNHRMNLYANWPDLPRLYTETNPNGFIPGEAAVALLLGKPEAGKAQTCITGIGFGHEPATIGSGDILRANGLSEAIRQAAADADIRVCDTDFRISSANGEEYWFKEASLAQSRTLEHKRDTHPLWHPADNIGEVGAAVGGAMVVMAHYAFAKGYAPGRRALCQISNDDHQRGAFILERTGGKG